MPCVPAPVRRPISGLQTDAFSFSPASADPLGRTMENATTLWTAPWLAFWAVTLESLNPQNYRF